MERATGFVLVAAVLGGACQTTRTSFVPTAPPRAPAAADQVQVSLLEPEGGQPLGIVQAYRSQAASVEELVPEFMRAVARAGGNYGKIDAMGVKFEETEETCTESYECGTTEHPATCTRTLTNTVETATLQVVGRAFHVARIRP
jgi:hypothetical protein